MTTKINGTVYLRTEAGNTVRSARYNTNQVPKVINPGTDKESYNLEGAQEYIRREKDRWEQSDQFVGTKLVVVVE